jgi:hypothetical protein
MRGDRCSLEAKEGAVMRAAIIFAAVLVLGLCGEAWSQSSEAWIFGTVRCATWLSNPTFEEQGELWILGYWSGMNVFHEDRMVGHQVDPEDIFGEVRKICILRPTEALALAVREVYGTITEEHR